MDLKSNILNMKYTKLHYFKHSYLILIISKNSNLIQTLNPKTVSEWTWNYIIFIALSLLSDCHPLFTSSLFISFFISVVSCKSGVPFVLTYLFIVVVINRHLPPILAFSLNNNKTTTFYVQILLILLRVFSNSH